MIRHGTDVCVWNIFDVYCLLYWVGQQDDVRVLVLQQQLFDVYYVMYENVVDYEVFVCLVDVVGLDVQFVCMMLVGIDYV